MIVKRLYFFFLFVLFSSSISARDFHYDQMRVARIDIIPENLSPGMEFDPLAIKTRLQIKTGGLFSQLEFDQDLKFLAGEYDRAEPALQVINGEVYITLRIWLKPTIRSILFLGNERFSVKKLNKELGISLGSLFERDAFIQSFNKLKVLYIKKGYFEVYLDFEVIPLECNQIDIQINIIEGRAGRIKCIEFCGLTSFEENEILELMVTRKYNFLLSWYTGRGCYHPDMIEHDRLILLDYLQNKGYADALVDISFEEIANRDRIILCINVDKGPCFSVGEVTLSGNCLFSDEEIWEQSLIYPHQIYSPESLRSTVKSIRDLYGSCGFIDCAVDVQLFLREDCPIYDVAISIEEGEQYNVGMIHVFGNHCTQPKIVLHESLLCPGEVFDIRKLEGTEARLCNTGFFSTVNVYAVKPPEEAFDAECNYRDVFIEVEEADTGNVSIFFGFSSLQNLYGGVELSEQNFNLSGVPHVFQQGPRCLRGGGEYLHMKAHIGNRQTTYLLQWTKPYFMDTEWIVGFDLEKSNNRSLSSAYEIKTYGGSVHATYIFNDFLKHDIHYRARQTHISVSGIDNPIYAEEASRSGFISAAGTSLIYDSTDHPRRPTCGIRSRLLYELAGLGGNYQFMKLGYLNSLYYPISARGTLKFRADIQFIHTYGNTNPTDLPLSERLFLGGDTTVRGYRPFIIGPKFGNREPRGGVSSYLISEEYQHNLLRTPCIDAFFFVDAGYVSLSEFTIGRQAASVGFGFRVEVMRNIPMTIGLGWPIHPIEKITQPDGSVQRINNAQRFFFSMGGCF